MQDDAAEREESAAVVLVSNGSAIDKTACHREEGAGPSRGRKTLDRQLQKALDANLRELELMHKRVRPPHVV